MRAHPYKAHPPLSDKPESDAPESDKADNDSLPGTNAVNGLLRIGAGIARVAAEASSGKAQPEREGEAPLQAILRYGSTAAGSLIAMTVHAAREAGLGSSNSANGSAPPTQSPASAGTAQPSAPAAPRPALPVLKPGGKLRLPMSIDNPSDSDMRAVTPKLISITRLDGDQSGKAKAPAGIKCTFTPAKLDIAAHDFEKLVVTVSATKKARSGDMRLLFSLGDPVQEPVQINFRIA